MVLLLLLLLVDLLLTLQDFLHELQWVARPLAIAEGILNRLGPGVSREWSICGSGSSCSPALSSFELFWL